MGRLVRISDSVLSHLSGSEAWQCQEVEPGIEEEVLLMQRLKAANRRKDGSIHIRLDSDERACLYEYAEAMAGGARDNIEPPGQSYGANWALAEYNAAAGLMRQLDKIAWQERIPGDCGINP